MIHPHGVQRIEPRPLPAIGLGSLPASDTRSGYFLLMPDIEASPYSSDSVPVS
jgi:hypothetical protein